MPSEKQNREKNRCLDRVPMIHGFVVMAPDVLYRTGLHSSTVFKGNFADMPKRACNRMIPLLEGGIWPAFTVATAKGIAQ